MMQIQHAIEPQRPYRTDSPHWAGPQRRSLIHPLMTTELQAYQQNGFLLIRSVFSPEEIDIFQWEAHRMVDHAFQTCQNLNLDPGYNLRFEMLPNDQPWKVDPFISVSPLLATVVTDRRIMDRLSSVYDGYEGVLFKDKLIFKPADSHGNGIHQDYNWWQGFPKSLLTVAVALDNTSRENGCTEFWTGYQQGFLHQSNTFDGQISRDWIAKQQHIYAEMQAGDIAIFSCFTPHAAAANKSSQPRRMIFLSYNNSQDGEHYTAHYSHFRWYRTRQMSSSERAKHYFI